MAKSLSKVSRVYFQRYVVVIRVAENLKRTGKFSTLAISRNYIAKQVDLSD